VPFQRPTLPAADLVENYFARSRAASWFSNDGPCVTLLRDRLARYVGDGQYCVAVASGTLGLMVALRGAVEASPERRPPLEVLVPSFTYIASISAILWSGLQPVFVDVAADHWNIDPVALETALRERSGKVAAVLACSTFGCAPPIAVRNSWEAACAAASIPLVVDSAAGFGSRDESGRPLGRQGIAEVFSFHATKPLAIGEGGAVMTADRELADRIARQTRFGLDGQRELAGSPGLNAKMSEIHAATALAALDGFDEVLSARSRRSRAMREGLVEQGFTFQLGCDGSAWQFVPVLARSPQARDRILREARAGGVQLRTYHEPLHMMPALEGYPRSGDLPVTLDLAGRALSLPLANDLTDDEIARVRSVLELTV
jgi:dTDP-4-amino-4,6-dideoxygalactose transaminase